jgi:hypothetical protein
MPAKLITALAGKTNEGSGTPIGEYGWSWNSEKGGKVEGMTRG